MYDVSLSFTLASLLNDKSSCFSYSKLVFSVVCLREQYLLVYISVIEKYGKHQCAVCSSTEKVGSAP